MIAEKKSTLLEWVQFRGRKLSIHTDLRTQVAITLDLHIAVVWKASRLYVTKEFASDRSRIIFMCFTLCGNLWPPSCPDGIWARSILSRNIQLAKQCRQRLTV